MNPAISRGFIQALAIVIAYGCVIGTCVLFWKQILGNGPPGRASRLWTSILSGLLYGLAFLIGGLGLTIFDGEYACLRDGLLGIVLIAIGAVFVASIVTYLRLVVVGKYNYHRLHEPGKDTQRRHAASGGESDDA